MTKELNFRICYQLDGQKHYKAVQATSHSQAKKQIPKGAELVWCRHRGGPGELEYVH